MASAITGKGWSANSSESVVVRNPLLASSGRASRSTSRVCRRDGRSGACSTATLPSFIPRSIIAVWNGALSIPGSSLYTSASTDVYPCSATTVAMVLLISPLGARNHREVAPDTAAWTRVSQEARAEVTRSRGQVTMGASSVPWLASSCPSATACRNKLAPSGLITFSSAMTKRVHRAPCSRRMSNISRNAFRSWPGVSSMVMAHLFPAPVLAGPA
mmetsp:Transcript_44238/g.116966  ORF Transcript_44238/g.116966 Transcript_44238/m.116966 type:complete len:216 (-) Transcript_44238:117-764(-)